MMDMRNTPHKFLKTYVYIWHPIDCWCEMGFPIPESWNREYEALQMEMGEAELYAELTGRVFKW